MNSIMYKILIESASSDEITQFLNEVLDILCEDGFTSFVNELVKYIKLFAEYIFSFKETKTHVIRDIIF